MKPSCGKLGSKDGRLLLTAARSADPVVGNHILQRRKEYQQSAVTAKIIGAWSGAVGDDAADIE
jgi:hypothetical protein